MSRKTRPRVLVALSGGVDSSVAAALLVREGYDVAAIFYELWAPEPKKGKAWENNCCTIEAYRDAERVAKQLEIPLFRANIANEFKERVVKHFVNEYASGKTPNPCVVCNTDVRFGLMFDRAVREYKADYLATGHYAIRDSVDSWKSASLSGTRKGPHRLYIGSDQLKDQSYFLYRVPQRVLGKLLFPVGNMKKTEVRSLARQLGLPTASKHDSQEICFVPRGGVAEFIKREVKPAQATIQNTNGQKIADHDGVPLVTIGQRRGLGAFGAPYYVVNKDSRSNTITVSANPKDERLFARSISLTDVVWVGEQPQGVLQAQARGRHGQVPFDVEVLISEEGVIVTPLVPTKVIAAGQTLVLIRDREVLGGGTVQSCTTRATLKTYDLVTAR